MYELEKTQAHVDSAGSEHSRGERNLLARLDTTDYASKAAPFHGTIIASHSTQATQYSFHLWSLG